MSGKQGAKALVIISKSTTPVKLNENESSLSSNKRYILEGVFGVVNTDTNKPNRNDRIYDESEYLPHIMEFRSELSKGIPILGELDHPVDGPEGPRFEVLLKNASHRILDLWYDKAHKLVMGKLEVLDTPNGKIVKSLIDAGIPIYVSSRASGFVNPNKHVTIHKIFTWDIVAKPGFEEAQVRRVNESLCESYNTYLTKLEESSSRYNNVALKYNVLNENTCIYEFTDSKKSEPKKTKIMPEAPTALDRTKCESQIGLTASKFGSLSKINKVNYISEDGESHEIHPEDKKEKSPIKSIEYKSKADQDKEDSTDVVKIKPVFANELSGKEKEEYEKKEEAKKREASTVKESSYDDLIKKYESKEEEIKEVKESYGWTNILNQSQLKRFVSLTESQKEIMTNLLQSKKYFNLVSPLFESNCNRTLQESTFRSLYYDVLNYTKHKKLEESYWFQAAPQFYKDYFRSLSESDKDKISRKAEFFIFENSAEVEDFWVNMVGPSDLKQAYLNERDEFIFKVPKEILNEMVQEEANQSLGYSLDEVSKTEALLESYKI